MISSGYDDERLRRLLAAWATLDDDGRKEATAAVQRMIDAAESPPYMYGGSTLREPTPEERVALVTIPHFYGCYAPDVTGGAGGLMVACKNGAPHSAVAFDLESDTAHANPGVHTYEKVVFFAPVLGGQ